ncbi:MAG: hypothetical protein AAGI38_16595 [Bacteroidota bacterium]
MKNYVILGVLTILFLIPVAIWDQRRSSQIAVEHVKKFNEERLSSLIQSVRTGYKGVILTFKGSDKEKEYVFYPYTNEELNKSKIFSHTAEKGDSIFKPAFSDTLVLFKNGEALKYTFRKFD